MPNIESKIEKYKSGLDIAVFSKYIPPEIIEEYKTKNNIKIRNRIYGYKEVVYGSFIQASNDDKSLSYAVSILSAYQDENIAKLTKVKTEAQKKYEKETEGKKKKGRPRKRHLIVPKSKLRPISLNTASYDEARQRVPLGLYEHLYKYTTTPEFMGEKWESKKWKGHEVLIVDGTTIFFVDTPELREEFISNIQKEKQPPLPAGRIEGLIELYSGNMVDFRIGKHGEGELSLLKQMSNSLDKVSILLGDDLYCTYGHFAYSYMEGKELVAQGKRLRNEKVIKQLGENDCIVEWKSNTASVWLGDKESHPERIEIRKVSKTIKGKENKEEMMHVYTTLTDNEKYKAKDIMDLYFNRWEIEQTFKEIKTEMGMEYLRGKTKDSVKKEIYSHIIVYNILRKIIANVFPNNKENFPPLRTSVQTSIATNKVDGGYIDKLGRSYAKKSTGRPREKDIQDKA